MAYPGINGAAINMDEVTDAAGVLRPTGIELVRAGSNTAYRMAHPGGEVALEFGGPRLVQTLKASGLDLVQSGQAVAQRNTSLYPVGIDVVSPGEGQLVVLLDAQGVTALEFGSHRLKNGTDVVLRPSGVELCRSGIHSAEQSQLGPIQMVQANSSRPLAFGDASVLSEVVVAGANGAVAMELGLPGTSIILAAASGSPFEVGHPELDTQIFAGGSIALGAGTPSIVVRLPVLRGIDLGKAGVPTATCEASELVAIGGVALELGEPSEGLSMVASARPQFPMELGAVTVQRGFEC